MFNKDFNNDFKIWREMTKDALVALIDAKITGQGSAIDAGSALPDILKGIIDLIKTPYQAMQDLTLESAKGSFESATDLTKTEAAAALGVSEADLDKLFAGSYLRLAYNGGSVLSVDSSSAAAVSLGAGAIVIEVADSVYSITVA